MPVPFSDITLLLSTGLPSGTVAYWEEQGMINYISDLYCRCMLGYKPPYCSRIIIHPLYHTDWSGPRKTGSLIAIAPFFDAAHFILCDRQGKYHHLLNTIQECMLQLSDEYHWNRTVFEKAYQLVQDKNFVFQFDFPSILSRNRQVKAFMCIEKTERVTTLYACISNAHETIKVVLYEKVNSFWHDCSYVLARHAKWFDSDGFGIDYKKENLKICYSLANKTVNYFQNDLPIDRIDFRRMFWMQLD